MKKLVITVALALLGVCAFAQEVAGCYPAWFYEIKGGAAYTAGETSFGKLISPTAEFDAGYQFTPTFSLRGGLSGWEAKGFLENTKNLYKWNFVQLNVDAMFDLLNLFARKKRSDRALNPYVLAGIGANLRFNNAEALSHIDEFRAIFPDKDYVWDGAKLSPCGRVGIGVGIRLSDAIALTLEVDENIYTDRFNSKPNNNKFDFDYRCAALAGVKFTFGAAKKKAAALAAAPLAAEAEAAARAAAEKAAAEKAAAEAAAKAAAARAAAQKVVEQQAETQVTAEDVAEEVAVTTAVRADARQSTNNIYFAIGKNDIRVTEAVKVAKIVELLKTYPEAVVSVSGYADKATGNPKINMEISARRAETVAKAIEDAGISKDRITVEYYGDTVQPYAVQTENRVSICVTK